MPAQIHHVSIFPHTGHSQQAVHVLGGGGHVVVVFTGEAQFSAVTLVYDVPELFGGQRLGNDTEVN